MERETQRETDDVGIFLLSTYFNRFFSNCIKLWAIFKKGNGEREKGNEVSHLPRNFA